MNSQGRSLWLGWDGKQKESGPEAKGQILLPCSQPFSPQPGDWDTSTLPWGTAPKDPLPLMPQGQGCSPEGLWSFSFALDSMCNRRMFLSQRAAHLTPEHKLAAWSSTGKMPAAYFYFLPPVYLLKQALESYLRCTSNCELRGTGLNHIPRHIPL